MNNIMLDLETMGTGPDATIIAIGAVRFDTDITDRFHCILSLQSSVDAEGLSMDLATVLWWMKQSEETRAQFDEEGTEIDYALIQFEEWLGEDAIVWGNGADFDNAILANAYRALKRAEHSRSLELPEQPLLSHREDDASGNQNGTLRHLPLRRGRCRIPSPAPDQNPCCRRKERMTHQAR